MDLNAAFFAIAIPAVLFAGVSKGGFGGGAGFAAAPLLALIMEPAQAVGLMLPLLMMMDVTGLRTYWRRWSVVDAARLMIGMAPGVALGWLFFRSVSPDAIRLFIGLIAIGFVVWRIARERGWLTAPAEAPGAVSGLIWGGVAGFTSFVSHAGGPPAAMYLLGRGLDKTTYQATTVISFWWVNLIKFVPYVTLGMFTMDSARANLMLAPVAVAGVLLGAVAHRRLPEALFFRVTYALLLITGSKLVWDALV